MAALVAVPVFFDPHTVRTFDADKILLFRSIAVVMGVGLIIWGLERGRRANTSADGRAWRSPVVIFMALLTGAYCLSTAFSIAPRISFWGGYFRSQGTYTWLGYAVVFSAIVLLGRRRQRIERLVNTVLLASVPPAIYGLMQHVGRDPYDWSLAAASASRIVGTAGNPIFLSAFMIMVVPLTLVRVIQRCAAIIDKGAAGVPPPSRLQSVLLAAAYLVLLALQLLTIKYSQSRGPMLGLAVGLVVFSLTCAAQYRTRWMAVFGTGVAALCIGGLLVFAFPSNRPSLLSTTASTVKVRLLIWQGAADLLAAQPLRTIFGYGPETLVFAYEPFYPPELARYEGRISTPDRAHNDIFDTIIAIGIVGCAAQVAFFMSIFHLILRRLGMVRSRRHGVLFTGAMGGGGLIAAVISYAVDGSLRFSGVGFTAGMVAGLIAYLVIGVVRNDDARKGMPPHGFILAALLAAIVAHLIEIQGGFATASTRLYLVTFAALAVAIGARSPVADAGVEQHPMRDARLWPSRRVVCAATVVGLTLNLLTYEFSVPSLRPSSPGFVLLWLFLGTWIGGMILLVVDSWTTTSTLRRRLTDVCGYAGVSVALWLPFALVHLWWIKWRPLPGDSALDSLREVAAHVGHTVSLLYVFFLVILFLPGLLALRGNGRPADVFGRRPLGLCAIHVLVLIGAVAIIIATNLAGARADAFAKLGATFGGERRLNEASVLYSEAQRLNPTEEAYATELARVLMEQSRTAGNATPEQRVVYLERALATVQRAQVDNPANPTHVGQLARIHRLWAGFAVEPAEQARHFELCESYYRQATQRSPRNPDLWKEWATLYLERQQPDRALEKLDASLRLYHDPDTADLIEGLKKAGP